MQFVHNAFIELDPSCSTTMGCNPFCGRIIILGKPTLSTSFIIQLPFQKKTLLISDLTKYIFKYNIGRKELGKQPSLVHSPLGSLHKLRLHFLAFDHIRTPHSPHFLYSKLSIFLTTYPTLNANVICEGSWCFSRVERLESSLRSFKYSNK